jgi:CRP-like cAMP-binding protein
MDALRGYWGMLTQPEQATLRTSASSAEYASAPLIQQGAPLNHVLIIRSGWAKATTVTATGQKLMLRLYGPGDIVGLGHALTDEDPVETVTAVYGPVHALTLTLRRFDDFVEHAPNASKALHRVLCQRLADADRIQSLRANSTGLQRVSGLLVELCRDEYSPDALRTGELIIPPVRLSQQELASWLGDSRKTVVRALAELRSLGVIETFPTPPSAPDLPGERYLFRRILIRDLDSLRDCAHPTRRRTAQVG